MLPWNKKKLIRKLESEFGKAPETDYFPGDMEWKRTFFFFCRQEGRDPFYVDETTWKDLNLDALYRRVNVCQCTAGEQYLYYMLRRPMDRETYENQLGLIHLTEERPDIRLRIQMLLYGVGRRNVDLTSVFLAKDTSPFHLVMYCVLALLLLFSIFLPVLFGRSFLLVPVGLLTFNAIFHEFRRTRCEHEINHVNYCVALALSLRKMQKWQCGDLDRYLADAYAHLKAMKPILRSGPVLSGLNADPLQMLMMNCLLADLIAFELLKKRLCRYHEHFLAVHEAIGRIDASVSIASYREGLDVWCEPEICRIADKPFLHAEGMVHPLLSAPVPNDLTLDQSLLITGSNASGKSTYLRASVLCALMAQTLCTCTCRRYLGSAFRIYTSMAVSDDLLAGESYYIAEIRSLKRILDENTKDTFVLCAVDEVLRGTNTVERIAASAEILHALDRPGTLCLIATHDIELCALAGDAYRHAHFEETVAESELSFDYKIKPGPAETRNAIRLLKLMGFDDSIVRAAEDRADSYMKTGKWI